MRWLAAVDSLGTPEQLGLPKVDITDPKSLQGFLSGLFILAGALAIIFIMIGGLKYVLSGGDQKRVSAAKETILYAVIGLIVSILALSIVQFVVTQVG